MKVITERNALLHWGMTTLVSLFEKWTVSVDTA